MMIVEERQDRRGKTRLPEACAKPGGVREAIDVSTVRYRCVHQHKPRGYRLWYFAMPDGLTFSYIGSYAEAKRAATARARNKHGKNDTRIQLYA